MNQSLETPASCLPYYNRLLGDIEEKSIDGETKFAYQDILLPKCRSSEQRVPSLYSEQIAAITGSMNGRFFDLLNPPILGNLVKNLDVRTWPCDENDIGSSGDIAISNLSQHFDQLVKNARQPGSCMNGIL